MINQERLVSTFLELVRIDNPSGHEEAMAEHVAGILREIGLMVRFDAAGNVLGTLSGVGPAFLLNAHLDSVEPCRGIKPVVSDGVIRSDGTTILGADDRAGVAAILEGIRSVVESQVQHRALEVVLTRAEEIGLHGAKKLDFSGLTARVGMTLDCNGRIGSIVVGAPAQNSMHVVIHGKAAHAGVAPEEGISAVVVASDAIAHMPLGRIDSETTANVGILTAGTARNIVPEKAELEAEARSRNETKLEAQTGVMVSSFRNAAETYGAKVDITIEREYSAYQFTAETPVVQLVCRALESIGVKPDLVVTGGGSDVNVFNQRGIEIANVSAGYLRPHTLSEELYVADLVKAAELVAALARGM